MSSTGAIGPAPARESYLAPEKILAAARESGAAAVHPGGIRTELGRYMDPAQFQVLLDRINKQLADAGKGPFEFKNIPQGAPPGDTGVCSCISGYHLFSTHRKEVVNDAVRSGGAA